jgi:hypothetical protein
LAGKYLGSTSSSSSASCASCGKGAGRLPFVLSLSFFFRCTGYGSHGDHLQGRPSFEKFLLFCLIHVPFFLYRSSCQRRAVSRPTSALYQRVAACRAQPAPTRLEARSNAHRVPAVSTRHKRDNRPVPALASPANSRRREPSRARAAAWEHRQPARARPHVPAAWLAITR